MATGSNPPTTQEMFAKMIGATPTPTKLEDTLQAQIQSATTTIKPSVDAISRDVSKALGIDMIQTSTVAPKPPTVSPLSDTSVKPIVGQVPQMAAPPNPVSPLQTSPDVQSRLSAIEKKLEEGFATIMLRLAATQTTLPAAEAETSGKQFTDFLPSERDIQRGLAGGARKTRKSRRTNKKRGKARSANNRIKH
jgi:hypothetical protein